MQLIELKDILPDAPKELKPNFRLILGSDGAWIGAGWAASDYKTIILLKSKYFSNGDDLMWATDDGSDGCLYRGKWHGDGE